MVAGVGAALCVGGLHYPVDHILDKAGTLGRLPRLRGGKPEGPGDGGSPSF